VAKILALEPDLVVGFSDLQASIATDLIRAGVPVFITNQRTVAEILSVIRQIGGLVGAHERADALVGRLEAKLAEARERARWFSRRPKVYFEEWGDPLITGILWVSELIDLAGGDDVFSELSTEPLAKQRILADPMEVVRRAPDLILGSWCGRKFHPDRVVARPGWSEVPAVRRGALVEVKSSIILQPGPAALTEGLDAISKAIAGVAL
jgi:iron complex transport system substrate-binding protein